MEWKIVPEFWYTNGESSVTIVHSVSFLSCQKKVREKCEPIPKESENCFYTLLKDRRV